MAFVHEKAFSVGKLFRAVGKIKDVLKKHKALFFFCLFLVIIDNALFCFSPYLINKITYCIVNNTTQSFMIFKNIDWKGWVYISFGFIFSYAVVELLTQIFLGKLQVKMEITMRLSCLRKLIDNDISYYSKNQLGLLMTKTITDSFMVATGFYAFMLNAFYLVVGSFVVFAIAFTFDVKITLVLLGVYLLIIALCWWVFIYFRRTSIISIDERQSNDRVMTDKLMNIRLIKSSGTENTEVEKVKELTSHFDKLHTKFIRWQAVLMGLFVSFGWIFPFVTTYLSIKWNSDVGVATTECVSFLSINNILIRIILFVPGTFRAITKTMNSVLRLNLILDSESIIKYSDQPIQIDTIDTIEFKDVEFTYPEMPDKQILPKINLKFEKGKKYAFVGGTGSGKSSIARLLLRLYDATSGEIIINNKYNIKDIDMKSYLSKVGYVEQEPQIIYGDVYENILYGNFDKTRDDAREVARQAQLDTFVNSLPQKYETILGERGFMLSGGQKQRIVIARTLLKAPDLLLLDEATSALDNIVEKEIQKSLDVMSQNQTTIAIAHRLSTIKDYDQIFVVAHKKGIVESGSYKELLKNKNGVFTKLHESGKY